MTLQEINAKAEAIARQYNPDKLAPFPYEAIIKDKADLDIIFLDLEDDAVSGVILYEDTDKRFNILVNAAKHPHRQHFTLGHELGHYFLHQDILKEEKGLVDGESSVDNTNILYRLDDPAEKNRIETEANHFAAGLLMPEDLVRDAWDATADIEECAKIFNVSTIAMSIRLTELGLVS
jgi:Zn-dependent peptidase ImmA (M78 family)